MDLFQLGVAIIGFLFKPIRKGMTKDLDLDELGFGFRQVDLLLQLMGKAFLTMPTILSKLSALKTINFFVSMKSSWLKVTMRDSAS